MWDPLTAGEGVRHTVPGFQKLGVDYEGVQD